MEVLPPESGEMIVRVRQAGVCASDVRAFQVGSSSLRPPIVLGHEISGEVAALGRGVTEFQVGDRVCVDPDVYCGKCQQCRTGSENLCDDRIILGYDLNGGFSEYVRIPRAFLDRRLVYKLPSSMTLEEAALVEPLSCCFHGLLRSGVCIGRTVVVVGDGPIGLMHLILAKAMGARVGLSGLIDRNLALAKRLGADFVVNATTSPLEKIRRETNSCGADNVIVAVGLPSVIEHAIEFSAKRGVVTIFGGCAPNSIISVNPNRIHYEEVTLTGSSGHTNLDYRTCFQILAGARVKLGEIITHRFSVREITKAFEVDIQQQSIKTLIQP
jgi:L-iditol 2-dehydrogenase